MCLASVLRSLATSSLPLLLVLLLLPPLLPGQAAQEPGKYTAEEYKAYQEVVNEADPAKKVELAVKFLLERPQSTLRPHILASYQEVMKALHDGQKWAELIARGEQFLAAVPDDTYTVSMLATAYHSAGNLQRFAAFGEKVFAQNPNGNTAYYLAKAYLDLKNIPKFLQWGEKTVELLPDKHDILLELTKKYGEADKKAQAAKYARLCLKALPSTKPEGVDDKAWREYATHVNATCYNVIGNVAFDQKDYGAAIANLENSLKYYKRNDLAYYNLAQAYWQQGKIDMAMKNFAKTFLLKTPRSPSAKQHLDNLYKQTHQNSLVGLERVIDKAQEELR